MDVFFCRSRVTATDRVSNRLAVMRNGMRQACLARWSLEPGAQVLATSSELYDCDEHEYQRLRRVRAWEQTEGPFYVVADDDCLLESMEPVLEEAVGTLRTHPDFAEIAFWPTNSTLGRWKAENESPPRPKPYEDEEVMEHVSVGGIRVYRKIPDLPWPPIGKKLGYDYIEAEMMREKGYKVGWFKNLKMNHLGRHYSTVWRNPGV